MKAIMLALLLAGCSDQATRGRWQYVVDPVVKECPGGRVNVERRTIATSPAGITRNTTTRTNTCLD